MPANVSAISRRHPSQVAPRRTSHERIGSAATNEWRPSRTAGSWPEALDAVTAAGRSTTALSKKIACGSRLAWRKTVSGSTSAAASATRQPDGVIHVWAIHA
jgi:hypothetical protein